jgi:TonB family protein
MKKCPRCGKQYAHSEAFCETDGTALVAASEPQRGRLTTVMTHEMHDEDSLECPVCGGKALPGEVRCNYCGARLRAESAESASAVPPAASSESQDFSDEPSSGPQEFGDQTAFIPTPDSSKPSRRVFTILGFSFAAIVALAAGVWFALYLGTRQTPGSHGQATSGVASAPTVQLAKQLPIRVQGDLAGTLARDNDSLLKAFNDNKAGLASVYENALTSDPSMSDGLVARLHILPDGTVDNGAVRISTSGNPSFDAEVIQAMTSWKFTPVTGSGVTADYPIIFAPSGSGAAAVESDLNTKLTGLSPGESPEYAFSPSGASPTAAAAAGPSAVPGAPVALGSAVPASEPTTLAGIPPVPPFPSVEATPPEIMPTPARVRHRRRAPELASLPPPKPPLIDRVSSALRADRKLRRVQAYTNGSVVTIFGKVFDDNDRLLAERTVRNTDGVTAVINTVTTDTQEWQQNQNLISQALQSAGLTDVQVKVIGRDAYLNGQVKTQLDRERAVTIAQAAAPVKVRENLITVAIGNMFGF